MSELEKMLKGEEYLPEDPELKKLYMECRDFLDELNATKFGDYTSREKLCRKKFGKVGKNLVLNKPFYCDYGFNIFLGDNVYFNNDCILLDVNKIIVGNNVLFAPRVCVYTTNHVLDKEKRRLGYEIPKPVIIGNDVWIGGNTVINPGVTIGDNVVIGSGSVVTKDIPSNVIAVGNPCKVIKKLI